MQNNQKVKLTEKYEVGLMIVSIAVVGALVAGISIWSEKGKEVAGNVLWMLTHTFGSAMQVITLLCWYFLLDWLFRNMVIFVSEIPSLSLKQ